jgi:hypothetical protein
MDPILTHDKTIRFVTSPLTVLLVTAMLVAAPRSQQQTSSKATKQTTSSEPSLADVARALQEQRAKENLKDVPLYTNDNLPKGTAGVGLIGSSNSSASASENEKAGSARAEQELAYLRYKLNLAQQQLQMHQREVAVLQQQLSQSSMQYYPNPNDTLFQEYSRRDINKLTDALHQKQRQVADDQKEIEDLQDQIQRTQGSLGSAIGTSGTSESAIPPGVKPRTKAYWQARLDAARQQLASAQEAEKLAEEELKLLNLQQLRTLDPNQRTVLAARINAKQTEVQAAKQAVEKAQQDLDRLEKEFKAKGSSAEGDS